MTKKIIKVGLIGCGGIARRHIEACLQLKDKCVVTAVCDIDRTRAEERAAMVDGSVAVYTDYRDMIEQEDIDVIAITTPCGVHDDPAVFALQAGKHIILEKPMAASLEECDHILEAAQESGCKVSIMFQLRFLDEIHQIREVLLSEVMGTLVTSEMNGYHWRGSNYFDVAWRSGFEVAGGGVTMNHSIHQLDLYLWLMNSQPVSVMAEMDTLRHNVAVEDVSRATIRFANGTVGYIHSSLNRVKSGFNMGFSSENQYVGYPLEILVVQQDAGGFPVVDTTGTAQLQEISDSVATGRIAKHRSVYDDMFQAIHSGGEVLADGWAGRQAMEVITAIYKSASTGQPVELPIAKDDPWYTRQGILDHVKRSVRG